MFEGLFLSPPVGVQAEKQSIRMQLDRTDSELRLSQEQNTLLTGKLHKAEREINSLNNQVREYSLSDKSDFMTTCPHVWYL